jgi:hypothetical protein
MQVPDLIQGTGNSNSGHLPSGGLKKEGAKVFQTLWQVLLLVIDAL